MAEPATAFPLLAHPLTAPAAMRKGQVLSAAQFLGAAHALAARLPDRPFLINLCRDRYHFALVFSAALIRGQTCLMPPSTIPAMIAQLLEDYPDAHGLTDCADGEGFAAIARLPADLAADLEAAPAQAVPLIPAGQTAAILFTSGSTGRPKPCPKSWGVLVTSSRAAGERLGVAALAQAHVIATVPAQHAFGLESSVLLPLQFGLVLHAERPFYPADVIAALEHAPRPRILATTPAHLRALTTDVMTLPPADLIICATAPLAPQMAAKAEALFGGRLMEIYGCTETGQLAARRTVQGAQWRCIAGIGLTEKNGQVWAEGGPVETPVALQDVIELEDAQRFLLHGRTQDLVNIAGKRSSLAFLNFHLNSIDGVRDGLFLMPAEQGDAQNRPMAFAVAPGMSADDVLAALRTRIDPAFLPRPLVLVDALPRNDMGKLPHAEAERLMAAYAG